MQSIHHINRITAKAEISGCIIVTFDMSTLGSSLVDKVEFRVFAPYITGDVDMTTGNKFLLELAEAINKLPQAPAEAGPVLRAVE